MYIAYAKVKTPKKDRVCRATSKTEIGKLIDVLVKAANIPEKLTDRLHWLGNKIVNRYRHANFRSHLNIQEIQLICKRQQKRARIAIYSYYKAMFPIEINGKIINPSQPPKITQTAFFKNSGLALVRCSKWLSFHNLFSNDKSGCVQPMMIDMKVKAKKEQQKNSKKNKEKLINESKHNLNLLRSMSTDRLSDLCVIAMHGNIPVSTEEIVNRFITLHPRRMQGQTFAFGQNKDSKAIPDQQAAETNGNGQYRQPNNQQTNIRRAGPQRNQAFQINQVSERNQVFQRNQVTERNQVFQRNQVPQINQNPQLNQDPQRNQVPFLPEAPTTDYQQTNSIQTRNEQFKQSDPRCGDRPRGQNAHPDNCALFYNCWDDIVLLESCPNGLLFDSVNRYCDYPENLDCQGRTDSDILPFQCPALYGNHPADDANCEQFWLCVDGKARLLSCDNGRKFDRIKTKCVEDYLATW
ncbi:hypothetical protein GQR58_004743 [Nymphon striatum]|nr:hypothetical protein GQR58_004743 [Nymphon striatum]